MSLKDLPEGLSSHTYRIRDLDMHVLEAGSPSSPLILLLHGFPELAFSWRKIMLPLASAGYHVVAPDQRGYGQTESVETLDRAVHYNDDLIPYRMINLVHDIVALLYGLGHTSAAAIVGHDFGSVVAAHCALIRPDLFSSLVCMSAPFIGVPPLAFDVVKQGPPQSRLLTPLAALDRYLASLSPPMKHYTAYLAGPTASNDMLSAPNGLRHFLRAYFHMKSGDWPGNDPHPLSGPSDLVHMPAYYIMPADITMPQAVSADAPTDAEAEQNQWLPPSDLDVYVEEFGRTGFQGGLNWYRASIDARLADGLSLFHGRKIEVPVMFLGGEKDWGVYQAPGGVEKMKALCPQMHQGDFVLVGGAGHWVQQERSNEVTAHLFRFLQRQPI